MTTSADLIAVHQAHVRAVIPALWTESRMQASLGGRIWRICPLRATRSPPATTRLQQTRLFSTPKSRATQRDVSLTLSQPTLVAKGPQMTSLLKPSVRRVLPPTTCGSLQTYATTCTTAQSHEGTITSANLCH